MAILASLQATALRVKGGALKARHPDWGEERLRRELRRRFLCLRDDSGMNPNSKEIMPGNHEGGRS
jgi:hypothetical protein